MMKIDSSSKSVLSMRDIFFEKIVFKNPNKANMDNLETQLQTEITEIRKFFYSVKVILKITHVEDSEFKIALTLNSLFEMEDQNDISEETVKVLIKKRTLSILFPYLRSQLTILTSQPNLNPIILPVVNIHNLIEEEE